MPFRRRFNCCCRNHPCPIFCPINLDCCENQVVNPIVQGSFGFFNNTAVGMVAPNAIIPLSLVQNQGSGISATASGGILLSAGTYQITYFAQGTIPAGGTLSVKIRLNGSDVAGSQISTSGTVGDVATLTQTITITILESSILELVNASTQNTTYSTASIFVARL